MVVMLSVLDTPVSDAAVRSGTDGVAGAVVSIVMLDEVDEVLPATSVTAALSVWLPSVSAAGGVKLQAPAPSATTVVSIVAPSEMVIEAPASAVPEMTGVPVAKAAPLSGAAMATVVDVSMVTDNAPERADTIEFAVAVAVMLWTPGVRALEVTDQTPPADAVAVPMSVAPS